MERLTGNDNKFFQDGTDEHKVSAVYFKLKAYEDAEEQGLLVRLPCKVGDTVYEITKGLSIYSSGLTPYIHETVVISVLEIAKWVINGDFDKTVFLTRESAEAALKEANRNGGQTRT